MNRLERTIQHRRSGRDEPSTKVPSGRLNRSVWIVLLSLFGFATAFAETPVHRSDGSAGDSVARHQALKSVSSAAASPDSDPYLNRMAPVGGSTFTDSINPYSGELMIHAVDVHLPGKGGLDLVIQRYYRSHIWNRGDNHPNGTFDITFHTAGTDVRDNMGGNGWQMHMGKMRSSGPWTTSPPTFITAGGSEHIFYSTGTDYPTTEATARISPNRWKLWRDDALPGWKIRTTTGRLFEIADRGPFIPGCWGGPCTTYSSSVERNGYIGMTGAEYYQVTAIENLHGDRITIHYDPTDANITRIVDTWDR